jgi:AP2 domain
VIEVPLAGGLVALIDDDDADLVLPHYWHARRNKQQVYAQTNVRTPGRKTTMQMHRLIMGFPAGQIDHRDLNGLNNQRSNLRVTDNAINSQNRRGYGISPYKGVIYIRHLDKWQANIRINGKRRALGCYSTQEEAALAYDRAALEVYGPEARTNLG